ncbi:MAG: copper resistance protein NlpE, partial [Endomicrobium sp.]|nr:copper resistance protein NlpE [Endomicrobium sp.]
SNDSTYILKRSHPNDKVRSFESTGKWIPTDDLSSIVLDYDKAKSDQVYLYFIDKNTIEWFDSTGERKENKNYRLKK